MAQPHPSGSGGGQAPRGRSTRGGPPSAVNVGLVALAGLLLLGVATGGGRETMTQLFGFLVFYCGVFTLVSLTLSVIVGLVATDRIMLVARHRVWVQSVHRTLGITSVAMLGLHIATEVMAARVSVVGALVPFTMAPFTIGAGSVAAYLMILVMWTGMVRARFAQTGKPWMWRPLHATAYLCWPVALWHGLNAGRPPAVWVTASYLLLAFLTFVALGLRLSVERNRRRQQLAADRTTTLIAPVGRPEPVGYERRAPRTSRSANRFRWDAPPADQQWAAEERPADLRADYRREAVADVTPVTAIPSYVDSFVEAPVPASAPRFVESPRFSDGPPRFSDDPPRFSAEAPRFSDEAPRFAEGPRFSDDPPYEPEHLVEAPYEPVYEPIEEPVQTYRGVAAPIQGDYDPYAAYPEPSKVDDTAGMSLRDRFAARRSAAAATAAAEAEQDRYADDDTPTLVNLDTRRELRRQEREQAQKSVSRGRRYRDDDDDDVAFWNRIRGEAR